VVKVNSAAKLAHATSVASLASCPSISSTSGQQSNKKSIPLIPVSNLHHLHSKSGESDEVASVGTSQRSLSRNKPQTGQTKKLLKDNHPSLDLDPKKAKSSQIKIVYRPLSARNSSC